MAVLLAAGAACSLPFDDIGFSGGSGGAGAAGGGAGSTTTTASSMTTQQQSTSPSTVTGFGGADCASGSDVCVPPAPTNWTGPVLLADDDTQSCGAPTLFGGLAADPGILDAALAPQPLPCTCGCMFNPSDCVANIGFNTCNNGSVFSVSAAQGCADSPSGTLVNEAKITGSLNASCPPNVVEGTKVVAYTTPRDACPVTITEAGCDDGFVCVPASEAAACVYQAGVVDCSTATGYPVRRTLVTDYTDGRSCTTEGCSCLNGLGACNGQVNLWDETGCGGLMVGGPFPLNSADCPVIGSNVASASYQLDDPGFQCTAQGMGTTTGTVTANPAVTYTLCCVE
ncbi:MAG: hypothetical protein HOV80_19245 [Polyangiaceae bacterium]|nr:hypothetical protein [Polyangiaceae bacterium]